jgi:hypothetical protein
MIRRAAFAVMATTLIVRAAAQEQRQWSPDHRLYYVLEAGQQAGKGEDIQRFVVYSDTGRQVAVAHVWLTEPDGTQRVGIRGCERSGWVDAARFYCEGSFNPSGLIYRLFDARTGSELAERGGSGFTWSPDLRRLANIGNVPHFSSDEEKSQSVEIEGEELFPRVGARVRHRFRSGLTWSSDSAALAFIDHRDDRSLHLVVIRVSGGVSEYLLRWREDMGEWPPDRNYFVKWTGALVEIRHLGELQTVDTAAGNGRPQ